VGVYRDRGTPISYPVTTVQVQRESGPRAETTTEKEGPASNKSRARGSDDRQYGLQTATDPSSENWVRGGATIRLWQLLKESSGL